MKKSIEKSKEELLNEIKSLKNELNNVKSTIARSYHNIYEHIFKHYNTGVIILETKDNGETFLIKDMKSKDNIFNSSDEHLPLSVGDVFYKLTQIPEGHDILKKVWMTGESASFIHHLELNKKSYYTDNHFYRIPTGEVVYTYKDITEEKNNEIALKESKEKYKSLFTNMLNGFGYFKIIEDADGNPINYRFLEVNKSMEQITGLKRDKIIGKMATEIHSSIKEQNKDWISFYANIAYTGKEERFEQYIKSLDKWYYIYAFSPKRGYFATIVEDITERKKTEQSLKQSEETYRQMFEENNAIKILVEPLTGDIVKANKSASKFYGYTIQELEKMNIKDILEMSEQEIKEEISRSSMKNPNQHRFKHRIASGEVRYVESISSPVTVNGRYLYFSIIFDVTDKKQVEDELRNLYRAVEQSPSTVVITNIDGYIEYVNPNFTRITGYTKEEATGEHSRLLKSGLQDDKVYKDLWLAITSGNSWKGIFSNKKKDGTLYWESALIAPVKDEYGNVTRFIKVSEDITQKLKAEEDLKKSYNTFATVMDSVEIGIYAVDIETHEVVFANNYVKNLVGDSIGKVCCDVFSAMGENTCRLCNNNRLVDNNGNPSGEIQWDYPKPVNGKWYTIRDKAITWIDGRMVRLTIITDITKNKIAEEELIRSNQELEVFAHRVSHDLKNPLSVVISYIRIIQMSYLNNLDEEGKMMSKEVINRTQRMINMIDNLLSYSEVSNGEEIFDDVDTNSVVRDAMDNLELDIEKTDTIISTDNLPVVVGDETQLVSVFQNLISNAIKYSKKHITPEIHITADDKGNEWLFKVIDNGIGINKADLKNIFFIFHRLHKNQEEFSGSGIGLSSCKKIVEKHGGKIWVESEPDKGSTFFFTISKSLDKNSQSA